MSKRSSYDILLEWAQSIDVGEEQPTELIDAVTNLIDNSPLKKKIWLQAVLRSKMGGIQFLIDKAREIDNRMLDSTFISTVGPRELIRISEIIADRINTDLELVSASLLGKHGGETPVDARSIHFHVDGEEEKSLIDSLDLKGREKVRRKAEELIARLTKVEESSDGESNGKQERSAGDSEDQSGGTPEDL
jgi:hypothetical protein